MKEVFRKLMQIVSLVILIGSPMFLYSAYKINQSYKSLQNYKLKECKIKDVDYDYTDSGVSGGSFIVQAKYNDYFVYWEDRIEENFIVDSFNSNRKVKVWIHENFKRALYIGIDGKKDLAYYKQKFGKERFLFLLPTIISFLFWCYFTYIFKTNLNNETE